VLNKPISISLASPFLTPASTILVISIGDELAIVFRITVKKKLAAL
jgi:hypothetical protein